MKTKEEIIREAYGECWKVFEPYISYYGWTGKSLIPFMNLSDLEFKGNLNRPKSLNGIETNNSWTKIKSEFDLPKESGLFWIVEDGHIINKPCNYCKLTKKWFIETYQYPTHYTPVIIPEKLPLH